MVEERKEEEEAADGVVAQVGETSKAGSEPWDTARSSFAGTEGDMVDAWEVACHDSMPTAAEVVGGNAAEDVAAGGGRHGTDEDSVLMGVRRKAYHETCVQGTLAYWVAHCSS